MVTLIQLGSIVLLLVATVASNRRMLRTRPDAATRVYRRVWSYV